MNIIKLFTISYAYKSQHAKYSSILVFKYSSILVFKYSSILVFKYSSILVFKYCYEATSYSLPLATQTVEASILPPNQTA